jgi:hypothetical protein
MTEEQRRPKAKDTQPGGFAQNAAGGFVLRERRQSWFLNGLLNHPKQQPTKRTMTPSIQLSVRRPAGNDNHHLWNNHGTAPVGARDRRVPRSAKCCTVWVNR